ncbi:MAG: DUF4157 domain-containing protein [Anaerolineae bacterium]|jgi:hypothetical protein|nr:DUF4157 domain-containing protein [Anaerolineae bacterium]
MAGGSLSNRLASRIYGSLGHGNPLSADRRARWEQAYGAPLDSVRVHDDAESDALSLSISASAFTLGNDIFLSRQADSADEHLLGHEIAHVVQQRTSPSEPPGSAGLVVGAANDSLEGEAEAAANGVSSVWPSMPVGTGPVGTGAQSMSLSVDGTQPTPLVQRDFLDELNLGNISGILGTGGSIIQGAAEAANLPLARLAGVTAPQMTSVPGLGALGGITSLAGLYTGGRDMLDKNKPWYERGVGAMSAFGGATGLASTISGMFGSSLFAAGGSAGLTAGAGSALTGGGAGLLTGAGAATALGSAGAVLGAGAAGYGAGRLLDEGVGALGQAITGDEQGDYTISGGLASAMTAADQGLTSLWADPDRPAYTQTIGWQLGELLGI